MAGILPPVFTTDKGKYIRGDDVSRKSEPLDVTIAELKAAGFDPVVIRNGGGHWKVKCVGLPPISVSVSAGDVMAVHMARRTVRKILAQNTR